MGHPATVRTLKAKATTKKKSGGMMCAAVGRTAIFDCVVLRTLLRPSAERWPLRGSFFTVRLKACP